MKKNKKEKISVTVDEAVMQKIKEMAQDENRNISNIVETALIEYIKK